MYCKRTGESIYFEPDDKTYIVEDTTLWFKGYFFFNNNFYQQEAAAELIYILQKQNLILSSINSLNGVFTALILHKKEVTIFNDRYGFGHLFYTYNNQSFAIADDIWDIVTRENKRETDHTALIQFMAFHYALGNRTVVKEIYEILPASVYTFRPPSESNYILREEYWSFTYSPDNSLSPESEKLVYSTLDKIISNYNRNVFNDEGIAINLTGGFDSRFLLALMLRNNIPPEQIKGYCYGMDECQDVKLSKKVARITGIEHHSASFSNFSQNFFDQNNIQKTLLNLGLKTYFYQGYGASSLTPLYSDTSYLLTGADGFFVGLFSNHELFSIKSKQQLAEYIYKKSANFISIEDCRTLLQNDIPNMAEILKDDIYKSLPEGEDYISYFYDWMIKNRLRKVIVSIHEILNQKNLALYPFYDYTFIDLMAKLPFEELYKQKAYFNALFKYALIDNQSKLRDVPAELRGKAKCINSNWILKGGIKENIIRKVVRHALNLPRNGFTYPTFRLYRFHKKEFLNTINSLAYKDSEILNHQNLETICMKNRRKENFFVFAIPNILSVFAIERMIKNKR